MAFIIRVHTATAIRQCGRKRTGSGGILQPIMEEKTPLKNTTLYFTVFSVPDFQA